MKTGLIKLAGPPTRGQIGRTVGSVPARTRVERLFTLVAQTGSTPPSRPADKHQVGRLTAGQVPTRADKPVDGPPLRGRS